MSAPPFMQLYIADYRGDTHHLTTEQHGAYLLLLMTMWQKGGSLPNDASKLARITGVSPRRWHLIADDVMAFFDIEGDQITQKRLVEEYQKCVSISEKRSNSGRAGGLAKSLKNNDAGLANAKQMPKHSQIIDTDTIDTPSLPSEDRPPSKSKGSSLPDDWGPKEKHFAMASAKGQTTSFVAEQAELMREWAISNRNRQVARKADWDLTFNGWLRRAMENQRTRAPPVAKSNGWEQAARKFLNDGNDDEPSFSYQGETASSGYGGAIDLDRKDFFEIGNEREPAPFFDPGERGTHRR